MSNYLQNDNFQILQDIVKRSDWKFKFAKECLPKITKEIRKGVKLCSNKHAFLSTDSASQMFDIYKLFLEDYLCSEHITTLNELYILWSSDSKHTDLFGQFHNVIKETSWRSTFMNEIVEELFVSFKKSHPRNTSKQDLYSIDEKFLYSEFLCVYFDYYTKSKNINNISDVYTRWSQDPEFCKESSFKLLNNVFTNNLWGILHLIEIYKTHKIIFKDNEWSSIFHKVEKFKSEETQFLFDIGRIYINDYKNYDEGCSLIKEIKSKNQDAAVFFDSLVKRERAISKKFKDSYIISDKVEWSAHPEGNENFKADDDLLSLAETLREKWIIMTQLIIHRIMHEKNTGLIYDFVAFIRELPKPEPYSYALENSPKKFLHAFRNDSRDKISAERMKEVASYDGNSFLELRFAFALICMNCSSYEKEGKAILKSLQYKYKPANYLLNENCKNQVLDKRDFRQVVKHNVNDALKEFCQIMVLFSD